MSAPTTHDSDNATTAQFLAPETHQKAAPTKLRIGDFRSAVDTLNWNRCDLGGATRGELIAMDVHKRLQRHIDIVQSLIPAVAVRFAEDIRHANAAIDSARAAIGRWQSLREEQTSPARALETNIAYLPLPVRCAIESPGNVEIDGRTRQRLESLMDHFLTVYGMAEDVQRAWYLDSAAGIAQRRYRIDAAQFGGRA